MDILPIFKIYYIKLTARKERKSSNVMEVAVFDDYSKD
jgi:hypothetical protein